MRLFNSARPWLLAVLLSATFAACNSDHVDPIVEEEAVTKTAGLDTNPGYVDRFEVNNMDGYRYWLASIKFPSENYDVVVEYMYDTAVPNSIAWQGVWRSISTESAPSSMYNNGVEVIKSFPNSWYPSSTVIDFNIRWKERAKGSTGSYGPWEYESRTNQ